MGNKGKTLTRILWMASALWMVLCLYLSWQTGEETVGVSGAITRAIRWVIGLFGVDVDMAALHALVRKNAHMAIFFVAGVLLYCLLRRSLPPNAHVNGLSFWLAVTVCSLLAVVAEVGKLWIPGRHLQWDETMLDVLGALCGATIAWAVRWLFCASARRRTRDRGA